MTLFVFIVPEREPAAMKHKQIDADKGIFKSLSIVIESFRKLWAEPLVKLHATWCVLFAYKEPAGMFHRTVTATCFQALEEQTAVSVNPVCPYCWFPLLLFYFRRGFLSSPNVDVDACMHLDTGEDTALS